MGLRADVGDVTGPAKDLAFSLSKRRPLDELEQIVSYLVPALRLRG